MLYSKSKSVSLKEIIINFGTIQNFKIFEGLNFFYVPLVCFGNGYEVKYKIIL